MEPQRPSADTKAVKVPTLPEDDLAHFEALVDRMLRDRAEASGFPAHGGHEPLVDAPKITISHPAEFRAERRFEEPPTIIAQPWHVRHARKLIGTGVLVVGAAGTAYVAYSNGWRFPAEPVTTASPVVPEPKVTQRPITHTPPAPAPTVAAEAPASAAVRTAPPPQPTAAAARKPAAAPRPSAPPPAPTAASAATRPPAVTHTLREAGPVPVAATAAPAVAAAPQPAAAPSDCPENVAALGLCASRISKGVK